jgi:hypothetical protein
MILKLRLTLLAASVTLTALLAGAQPGSRLPPRQTAPRSDKALGESSAVDEAKKMMESPQAAAGPAVLIRGDAAEELNQQIEAAAVPPEEGSTETALEIKDQSHREIPQSKLWLVLAKKPEMGFLSGWAFMRKELATIVGGGFTYGFLFSQELHPLIQAQVRLSGSHHREKGIDQKSSLNLFPVEFLAQFAREYGNLRFYVQPGLGGAFWSARSERLVDGYNQRAGGFDFMASGGLGLQYKIEQSPWRVGADASVAYVSGYFDNYFNRVLVYTSYQF